MSRRMLAVWGLMVAVVLAVNPQAHAQGRGGFGGGGRGMFGGGGVLGLAQMEPVQKELGIEKDSPEAAEIKKLSDAMTDERMAEMRKLTGGDQGAFQSLSQEERDKMMTKFGEINNKLTAKYGPDLKKLLKAEQYTRLQQINWQQAGTAAYADAEVVKALELSKEQQAKLGAVNTEFGTKQRELFQSAFAGGGGGAGGGNFEEMQKKVAEMTTERDNKAKEILSKDQQEKFATLIGKPFDLASLRPQGFGGGRGGAGGGRNAGRPGQKAEEKK